MQNSKIFQINRAMRKISLLALLLFFSPNALANLIINEIMADPISDESLNEWIELYNGADHEINLSNYLIGDDQDNDTLEGGLYNQEGTIIPAYGYAIITDEATRVYNNFNVSNYAIRLYTDDSSIGGYGLSNEGDTIYLYDKNDNLIDKSAYKKTSEDLSWAFINSTWLKAEPTPGYNNNGTFFTDTSQGCDFQIEIILANTLFDNPDNFTFKIRASKAKGTTANITARASIQDLYGITIKEYKPFTNKPITRQGTSSGYTPNLKEGTSYIINANLTASCNDSNPENNFDSRLITIKGQTLETSSNIVIGNIYDLGSDKIAKFGQIIRLKLDIYKGDTTKNSIAVWVEDRKGNKLSKQSKTNAYKKYEDYSLTLPIQIEPNCDEEFRNGDYYIIAKGLDLEESEKIKIEDLTSSLCKTKTITASTSSSKQFGYELLEMPDKIENTLQTKVKLTNNDNVDSKIKIWSYVYRGSKCYSGEREENKKEILLTGRTSEIISMENHLIDAEPGEYKYKIVINKDNQKTNKEITGEIEIEEKPAVKKEQEVITEKSIKDLDESQITTNTIYKLKIQPKTVYESVNEKIKKLTFVFLISLSVFLNIVLFWKR